MSGHWNNYLSWSREVTRKLQVSQEWFQIIYQKVLLQNGDVDLVSLINDKSPSINFDLSRVRNFYVRQASYCGFHWGESMLLIKQEQIIDLVTSMICSQAVYRDWSRSFLQEREFSCILIQSTCAG